MRNGILSLMSALLAGVSLASAADSPASPLRSGQVAPALPAQPAALNEPATAASSLDHASCVSDHEPCGPAGRAWVRGEYLLWWLRDSAPPPLVTTGPASAQVPGALGQPGTVVLFGGQ